MCYVVSACFYYNKRKLQINRYKRENDTNQISLTPKIRVLLFSEKQRALPFIVQIKNASICLNKLPHGKSSKTVNSTEQMSSIRILKFNH